MRKKYTTTTKFFNSGQKNETRKNTHSVNTLRLVAKYLKRDTLFDMLKYSYKFESILLKILGAFVTKPKGNHMKADHVHGLFARKI